MLRPALALLALVAVGMAACGPKGPPPSAASASSEPSADAAPSSSASPLAAQMVNATILTNGCQALGAANAKLAEKAMNQLIEGCTSVPGGKAQFEATLQPGGRIEIHGVAGHADVVPICVLKHALEHKVPLTQPCRLDVKIEQTSVTMTRDGGM
jgi:hypothetical protein